MLIKEKKKTPVVKLAKKPLNTGNKEIIGFEPSVVFAWFHVPSFVHKCVYQSIFSAISAIACKVCLPRRATGMT